MSERRQRKALERRARDLRARAREDACQLAVDLGRGTQPACRVTDLGVVLEDGEIVWREAIADYASYPGREEGWRQWGEGRWWVTSRRIVGRLPDGELLGFRWETFVGCLVDLVGERVTFDSFDGWRYAFSGPGVPPIGVAAIAHLHGVGALIQHPALAPLRSGGMGRCYEKRPVADPAS